MRAGEPISRRAVLGAAVAAVGGLSLSACSSRAARPLDHASILPRRPPAPPTRLPGSLVDPRAAPGTDKLPEIESIVVVMLENHSYDSVLGMLQGRGDGFRLSAAGAPTASNPGPGPNETTHAFVMPTPCQQRGHPYNTFESAQLAFDGGKMDGFVKDNPSGPVAMGYFDDSQLPFTYSLAQSFPLCDRYFCSVPAQTFPNRRYLTAGTSLGQIADTLSAKDKPPAGTIFELLNRHGISWHNYYSSLPSALIWLYLASDPQVTSNLVKIDRFFADAASGTLPSFSLVDPDFGHSSEEDPQDVQYGDQFLSSVVDAVTSGPKWGKTLLVWSYDEWGGYYDHVAPPRAIAPDAVAPIGLPAGSGAAFDRYGFRVPAGVVSAYGRPDYVSHVVHDHTSVLKLLETKWNLPALTYRDANADDLLDCVDLGAAPAFRTPPKLHPPADPAIEAGCRVTGPGTIPPSGAVVTS